MDYEYSIYVDSELKGVVKSDGSRAIDIPDNIVGINFANWNKFKCPGVKTSKFIEAKFVNNMWECDNIRIERIEIERDTDE